VEPVRQLARRRPARPGLCDYVHRHITFSYQDARSTRTAWEAVEEGKGVCRDNAHLAIAFCRCMNIPARYCTGYLGDIGIPPPYGPTDFAAWFEAYVGGRWHTFDPRNSIPRIGRVLIARGRDATDVAISNTFGATTLAGFTVWTDEFRSPLEPGESRSPVGQHEAGHPAAPVRPSLAA
jgi:transglutaminase-like putative cysteine protease